MQKLLEIIDKQIEFNQGKNIFLDESGVTLRFINDTVNAIVDIRNLSNESVDFLLDYITDKVLQEFYRVNQYYTFNNQSKSDFERYADDGAPRATPRLGVDAMMMEEGPPISVYRN